MLSHFTRITQFLNVPTFQSCQNPGKSSKVGKMVCLKKVHFRVFSVTIMELFPSDGCMHIIPTISLLKIDHFHVISPNMPSIVATVFSRKMTCNFDCEWAWKLGSISKNTRCFKEINDVDLDKTLIFQSKKSFLQSVLLDDHNWLKMVFRFENPTLYCICVLSLRK